MTKESLMEMGLTEEQAAKVLQQLEGAFVSKAEFDTVNAELKTTQKKHDAEMKAFRKESAVVEALRSAKAINPETVKPLLAAFLEKAELAEDGTVPGLSDEIDKLVKAEDTGFLFRTDAPALPVVSGAAPAGSVTASPDTKLTGYEARLADARKTGNAALAVSIKREAAADGIQLF